MKFLYYISFFILCLLFSCSKDKVPIPIATPDKPWEKFEGKYKVYDTMGNYLFDSEIINHEIYNSSGVLIDTIKILNFANSFDLQFKFIKTTSNNYLNFGFHDPIKDYNNKTWGITIIPDDTNTVELENRLVNNRMTLYFRKTNIMYWMNESVPYVYENVKHVYVKQP